MAAVLGAASVASAQGDTRTIDLTPAGLTIRGGVALPIDPSLTDVGASLFGLGIDYAPPRTLIRGGETYFSIDYFSARFGAGRGSVFPVAFNYRVYDNPNALRRNYYFVGVGATFLDVQSAGTAIGFRGGVGTELGQNIIAEITGYISDRAGGARGNAIAFYLGYRF